MKNTSNLRCGTLAICAAAASLTACSSGASQSAFGPSARPPTGTSRANSRSVIDDLRRTVPGGIVALQQTKKFASVVNRNLKIGPAKKVKGAAFLYASDAGSGMVDVYNWQDDQESLLGQAPGFQAPYGECSDRQGNVYVVDFQLSTISEFAYGTTTIIRTINDGLGEPIGCSVNPMNGDLAVSNFIDYTGNGGMLVYKGGTGAPQQYASASNIWPPGYDPKGNLYVLGEGGNCAVSAVCLEEFPNGGTAFYVLDLSGFAVNFPGAVEWDGKHLGVGDQEFQGQYVTGIYQVTVKGGTATAVSSTGMSATCYGDYNDIVQWAFDSKKANGVLKKPAIQVVGGDMWCQEYFGVWDYPKSGINNPILVAQGNAIPVDSMGQTLVTK